MRYSYKFKIKSVQMYRREFILIFLRKSRPDIFLFKFGIGLEWKKSKTTYKCANSRLGWYRRSIRNIGNYIILLDYLDIKKEDRLGFGLVNPFDYYLKSL